MVNNKSKKKYFKNINYRPIIISAFKNFLPVEGEITFQKGKVVWDGEIIPEEHCKSYQIKFSADFRATRYRVDVYLYLSNEDAEIVRERKMKINSKIPHFYPKDSDLDYGRLNLCLYYPQNYEWKPSDKLEQTIIPWTYKWLYYFEVWLTTDKWLGGGIEHEYNENKEK